MKADNVNEKGPLINVSPAPCIDRWDYRTRQLYLEEVMVSRVYPIHRLVRRRSKCKTSWIDIYDDSHETARQLRLRYSEPTDGSHLVTMLAAIRPDKGHLLASQSQVRVSFGKAEATRTRFMVQSELARAIAVELELAEREKRARG